MKGLSILIPVYDYNPTALITELQHQAAEIDLQIEIIVLDDASNIDFFSTWKAQLIKTNNVHVYRLDQNIGRAAIRNKLIQKASYDWLLFLDTDTIPCNKDYLQNYITFLSTSNTCVCGGTAYTKNEPDPERILRWKYGTAREEIAAVQRNNFPFETFTLNNLLIRKEVLLQFPLDNSIQKYGHEDTLLGMTLAANGLKIIHTDNFVYHEGLDTNEIFLGKVKQSIETLVDLYKQNKLPSKTKLIRLHEKLTLLKINRLVEFCIKPFIPSIEKNLLSPYPSMLYMDVLKLWYFEKCLNYESFD